MSAGRPAAGRYPSLAEHWRRRFGERVQRVSLDAGLSCPHRPGAPGVGGCTFCEPASFAPSAGDRRSVAEQLAAGLEGLARRGIGLAAAYFQPHTNTCAPLEQLRSLWDAAASFPSVVALCVGTRPDCVPDRVLDLLALYRSRFEVWLELGLQSARDDTLARLNRGHTAADFADAARRARARGLLVCAHVILGLPGETAADESATARFLAATGAEGLKLHQLAVVAGTALEAEWRQGGVPLLTEEEYAARVAAFVGELAPGTVLHRLVGDTDPARLLGPRFDKARASRAVLGRLADVRATPPPPAR